MRKKEIKIYISKKRCGFCFGVRRAVDMAEKALRRKSPLYSIGWLIHNEEEIKRLKRRGMACVGDIRAIAGNSTLLIRSHGLSPRVIGKARRKGIRIIDATCPFVKIAQEAVKTLRKENYFVLLLGDIHHPEVTTLFELAGSAHAKIVASGEPLARVVDKHKKIGIVAQTTHMPHHLHALAENLLVLQPREIRIFNTICFDVVQRQKEAQSLARRVERVLVVGGKNSANTNRLFQISKEYNDNTFKIQTEKNLRPAMVRGARTIGIVSGASTPRFLVERIISALRRNVAGQLRVISV